MATTHRRRTTRTPGHAGVVLPWLFLWLALPASSQPTNLEAYQALAVGCLAGVPDTARAVLLDAPAGMPYLRTALTGRWQEDGRTVFLADSSFGMPGGAPPWLRYEVEEARIAYANAGGKRLQRTVTLALRYTFTASDGRLLRDDRCRDTFTDTIRSDDRPAMEDEAFPETQAEPPRGNWRRRYLEPVILAAATAVTVYLFFNLRSGRSEDGL